MKCFTLLAVCFLCFYGLSGTALTQPPQSEVAEQQAEARAIQAKFLDDYTIEVSDSSETSFQIFHNNLKYPEATDSKERIWEFDICHKHNLIATAGRDCSLRLWNAKTGEPVSILAQGENMKPDLGKYRYDGGYIWSVAFSPDDELLAAASYTGQVLLFRVSDQSLLMQFEEFAGEKTPRLTVKFSEDGKFLVAQKHRQAVLQPGEEGETCLRVHLPQDFGGQKLKTIKP